MFVGIERPSSSNETSTLPALSKTGDRGSTPSASSAETGAPPDESEGAARTSGIDDALEDGVVGDAPQERRLVVADLRGVDAGRGSARHLPRAALSCAALAPGLKESFFSFSSLEFHNATLASAGSSQGGQLGFTSTRLKSN